MPEIRPAALRVNPYESAAPLVLPIQPLETHARGRSTTLGSGRSGLGGYRTGGGARPRSYYRLVVISLQKSDLYRDGSSLSERFGSSYCPYQCSCALWRCDGHVFS